MKRNILLTGATGTIGTGLAFRMSGNDTVSLRLFVRSPEKVDGLRSAGVEVVQGTFEDAATLRAAMEGIDTVVLITPFDPTAADQAHTVIVAAQEAQVRRIVRLSVIMADPNGPFDSYILHGRTDAEILASGLVYTIVRPNAFMQNFLYDVAVTISKEDKFYSTFGKGCFSMIDTRDIVDVFETVLLTDDYDSQILTLTGPANLSLFDAARIFSQVLGREVSYIDIPPEETEQFYRAGGLDGWYLDAFCNYSVAFRANHQKLITNDVERVTGHHARSLEIFTREVFAPFLRK